MSCVANGRPVYIAGTGMTRFGKFRDKSATELGQRAALSAILESDIDPRRIEAGYVGCVFGGMLAGQRVFKELGLLGRPIVNVENACSSGGTALAEAWIAVASGAYDTVLVLGLDKLSDLGGGVLPLGTDDPDIQQGLTMPALYAMRTRAYIEKYGGKIEEVAAVTVKNRRHAKSNEYAQYRTPVSVEDVMASRMIADPVTLLQMCPNADGAASVVLSSQKIASNSRANIRVLSSVVASGTFEQGYRDLTIPDVTVRAVAQAYEEAARGPNDIDVAEVHDAAAIAEVIYYEALGFCEQGGGLRFLESGASTLGGSLPVNPSGGLLCRGHPLGATGLAQVVEVTRQLRGTVEERQVEGAKTGLAHSTGGGIWGVDNGACTVHILGV